MAALAAEAAVMRAHIENWAKRDLSADVGDEAWAKMAHWSLGRAMNAQRGVIREKFPT